MKQYCFITKTKLHNGEKVRLIPLIPTIKQIEIADLCSQYLMGKEKGIYEMFQPMCLPIQCIYDNVWDYFQIISDDRNTSLLSNYFGVESQKLLDMLTSFIDRPRSVENCPLSRQTESELYCFGHEGDKRQTEEEYLIMVQKWISEDKTKTPDVDEKFHELFLNKNFVIVSESAYQLLSTVKNDKVETRMTIDIYENQFEEEMEQFVRFETGMRKICQMYIPIADGQKDNKALRYLAKMQLSSEYDRYQSLQRKEKSITCAVSKKTIGLGDDVVMIPFITNFMFSSENPLNTAHGYDANDINHIALAPIHGQYMGGKEVFISNLTSHGDDHLHAIQQAFSHMPYDEIIHRIIQHTLILPGGIKMGCMFVLHSVYFEIINNWDLDESEVEDVKTTTVKCLFDESNSRSIYTSCNSEIKNDFTEYWARMYSREQSEEFYNLFVHKGLSMKPMGSKKDIPFLRRLNRVISLVDYIMPKVYLTNKSAMNWDLVIHLAEMIRFDGVLSQLNQLYMPNMAGVADQQLVKKVARLVLSRTKNKY